MYISISEIIPLSIHPKLRNASVSMPCSVLVHVLQGFDNLSKGILASVDLM